MYIRAARIAVLIIIQSFDDEYIIIIIKKKKKTIARGYEIIGLLKKPLASSRIARNAVVTVVVAAKSIGSAQMDVEDNINYNVCTCILYYACIKCRTRTVQAIRGKKHVAFARAIGNDDDVDVSCGQNDFF